MDGIIPPLITGFSGLIRLPSREQCPKMPDFMGASLPFPGEQKESQTLFRVYRPVFQSTRSSTGRAAIRFLTEGNEGCDGRPPLPRLRRDKQGAIQGKPAAAMRASNHTGHVDGELGKPRPPAVRSIAWLGPSRPKDR